MGKEYHNVGVTVETVLPLVDTTCPTTGSGTGEERLGMKLMAEKIHDEGNGSSDTLIPILGWL